MPEISNVTTHQPTAPSFCAEIKQDIRNNATVGTFCGYSVHVSTYCLTHAAAFSCCLTSLGIMAGGAAIKGLGLVLAGVGIGAAAPVAALATTYCVIEKACIDRGARLREEAVHEVPTLVLSQPISQPISRPSNTHREESAL